MNPKARIVYWHILPPSMCSASCTAGSIILSRRHSFSSLLSWAILPFFLSRSDRWRSNQIEDFHLKFSHCQSLLVSHDLHPCWVLLISFMLLLKTTKVLHLLPVLESCCWNSFVILSVSLLLLFLLKSLFVGSYQKSLLTLAELSNVNPRKAYYHLLRVRESQPNLKKISLFSNMSLNTCFSCAIFLGLILIAHRHYCGLFQTFWYAGQMQWTIKTGNLAQ